MKSVLLLAIFGFCYINFTNACATLPSDCLYAFTAAHLNATNAYRIKHKVAPLKLALTNVTSIAQSWSCKVVDSFKLEHNANRGFLGENIYVSMSSAAFAVTPVACASYGQKAADAWYSEIKSYDFASGKSKDGGVIGHFTQLVWKGSSSVGHGLSFSTSKDSKGWYWLSVVADYAAPGNYVGQYTNNVFQA